LTISLGERIRLLRTRLRKNQSEFAQILGSQQTSVSRYEKDKVQPGLAVLHKLHGLAEPDEKEAFAEEIRRQIGATFLGPEQRSIKELRPMIKEMGEIQELAAELNAMVPVGRTDPSVILASARQLAEDQHIDESLSEILRLCVEHRKQESAKKVFQSTLAFLRDSLTRELHAEESLLPNFDRFLIATSFIAGAGAEVDESLPLILELWIHWAMGNPEAARYFQDAARFLSVGFRSSPVFEFDENEPMAPQIWSSPHGRISSEGGRPAGVQESPPAKRPRKKSA
jgi:transcriptional regulator with XRE-family HTH domain